MNFDGYDEHILPVPESALFTIVGIVKPELATPFSCVNLGISSLVSFIFFHQKKLRPYKMWSKFRSFNEI
jgi:hypothetical protein